MTIASPEDDRLLFFITISVERTTANCSPALSSIICRRKCPRERSPFLHDVAYFLEAATPDCAGTGPEARSGESGAGKMHGRGRGRGGGSGRGGRGGRGRGGQGGRGHPAPGLPDYKDFVLPFLLNPQPTDLQPVPLEFEGVPHFSHLIFNNLLAEFWHVVGEGPKGPAIKAMPASDGKLNLVRSVASRTFLSSR